MFLAVAQLLRQFSPWITKEISLQSTGGKDNFITVKQDEIMYTFSWAVGIFLGMTIRYEQGNKEDFKKFRY